MREKLAHGRDVAEHRLRHDPDALRFVELAITCGDLEAGDEAEQVPFERSRVGLVEVVEVEDERPVR